MGPRTHLWPTPRLPGCRAPVSSRLARPGAGSGVGGCGSGSGQSLGTGPRSLSRLLSGDTASHLPLRRERSPRLRPGSAGARGSTSSPPAPSPASAHAACSPRSSCPPWAAAASLRLFSVWTATLSPQTDTYWNPPAPSIPQGCGNAPSLAGNWSPVLTPADFSPTPKPASGSLLTSPAVGAARPPRQGATCGASLPVGLPSATRVSYLWTAAS